MICAVATRAAPRKKAVAPMSRKLLSKATFEALAKSHTSQVFQLTVLWPSVPPTRAKMTSIFSNLFRGGFSMEAHRSGDMCEVRFLTAEDAARIAPCPSLRWENKKGNVLWIELRDLVEGD